MTLRRRLAMFTIFWLVFILILFNVFVYVFVNNITLRSEQELLENKIDILLENKDIHDTDTWQNYNVLANFYNEDELIRIVNLNGKVINFQGSDTRLLKIKPNRKYVKNAGVMTIHTKRIAYLIYPLYDKHGLIGKIELYRDLNNLDSYLRILIFALVMTTLGSILFIVLGAYFLTTRLLSPIQGMVKTMRDINRSGKLKEINLAKGVNTMELAQLARAFNLMIGKLDRIFERQRHFIADASHELKTPITVITSYANLLQRWGKHDEAVRQEAIEAIVSQAQRLQNLTKSMLTLAEAEQEDWLSVELIDLIQLADETAKTLHTAFKRLIRLHTPKEEVKLLVDKNKMQQLFVILLDNAIKYSVDPIDVTIRATRDKVQIAVTDQGIGIPEEEIPNLFNRFYRVDTARSRSTGGVGLGLAIAKRIVELHEGIIEVFSKPGKGTTVNIVLPFKKV